MPDTLPITNNGATPTRRGLLGIEVKLSDPSPTAGSQFTIYVLVTNLFDVPIWPESPQVFLPSTLQTVNTAIAAADMLRSLDVVIDRAAKGGILPRQDLKTPNGVQILVQRLLGYDPDKMRVEGMLKDFAMQAQQIVNRITKLEGEKSGIREQIAALSAETPIGQEEQKHPNEFASLAGKTKEIGVFNQKLNTLRDLIIILSGSSAIIAEGNLVLQNFTFNGNLYVRANGNVVLDTPIKSRVVALDSSLRPGDPLQPGNTVVYSVALKTQSTLLFKPSQYSLQHSLNFSFEKTPGNTHTNTANQLLTIRAPIWAVMCGSILGGIAGYIARCLQEASKIVQSSGEANGFTQPAWYYFLLAFLTAIMSAMAIVFLARKSETQSMVSVEDFWGGLVVGFLVGYGGATAFENLANIKQSAAAVN